VLYVATIADEASMRTPLRLSPFTVLLVFLGAGTVHADWLDWLRQKTQEMEAGPAGSQIAAALTDDEIIRGLKEALSKDTQQAIADLGKGGGYLDNLNVKIPMPENLQKVEQLLRTLKQDKYADEFVATLNHAAEEAVPQAAAVFSDSISRMTLDDARGILKGPDDAATQYFRKTSEAQLREKFLPIVQDATDKAGVTHAYKQLMQKAGPFTQFLGQDSTDLDGYVTGKALDGLFKMIAEEEKRIRENPVARTTDLLKKVFGSLTK
jgi:Protein of unknown function (DUF4197)